MTTQLLITVVSLIPPVLTVAYGTVFFRWELVFNAGYTALCIIALTVVQKKFPVLKTGTYLSALSFVLLSAFAGRTFNLYALVPHWDKLLHFLSGFILASAAGQIYVRLSKNPENRTLLHIFMAAFGIAVAGLWEVYEFAGDSLFGGNAQNNSLTDTMLDIASGTASTLLWTVWSAIFRTR